MDMKKLRSPCPVACTLDLIGDKWALLIVRDLFAGKRHFKEFMSSPEKIATNILTARLKKLVAEELVDKVPSTQIPGKNAYQLTEKGKSLYPVLMAVADWGLEHIEGTQKFIDV